MIDVTGENLDDLLTALGANYPDTIASYVTGSDGVPATTTQWDALVGKVGLFRYDQSPALDSFASGAADCADVEAGAAGIATAVQAAQKREARGWYSWIYVDAEALADARAHVSAASLVKVQFGVANWNLSRGAASDFLAANPDTSYVQWASPTSNPTTICPGTNKTLAAVKADLNVTRTGWFVKHAVTPPPVVAKYHGIVVTSLLTTVNVSSNDGKTWT
jgi:hypothetical protein